MWLQARSTAHDGTPPAAAMPTPFNFPCGRDFLKFQQDKEERDRCAPPGFEEYWWSSVGYYSPAICPRGYTAGCFRWHSNQGPAVEATETAVQCVPAGYGCVTDDMSQAFSASESAPMIQVRWAETDLPGFVTHPLYPGVNPTDNGLLGEDIAPTGAAANDIAARQVSRGPDVSRTRDGDSSRPTVSGTRGPFGDDDERPNFPQFDPSGASRKALSTGAKAGIGVAVPVGLLLVAGIVAFFVRKARRSKSELGAQGENPPADPSTQPWAQPQVTSQGGKFEMPGEGGLVVELPPAAVTVNEKPELSSEISHRGAPSFPAELQTAGHNQQQYPSGQQSELPAASPHSSHHQYSELSGATTQHSRPIEMDSNQHSVQAPSPTYQTPSPGLQAPTAPPPMSTPPAAAVQTQVEAEPSAEELMQQQARLEERRQRLLELERIEREQEELKQRIKAQGRS